MSAVTACEVSSGANLGLSFANTSEGQSMATRRKSKTRAVKSRGRAGSRSAARRSRGGAKSRLGRHHKSISRIDQPEKNNHGWYVRVHFQGRQVAKFFADQKHGGKKKALAKALEFRDRTEKGLGKPRSERPVFVPRKKRGVVGVRETVYRTRSAEGEVRTSPVFEVTWSPKPGVVGRTSVSIRKWGRREAYRRAKDIRREKERKFYGW